MATVCFFHTGAELTDRFDALAAEYIPEAEYFHQVDESVIDDLLDVGELTPSIKRRICSQLSLAQEAGADVVLDTCSSTSPAVDVAREIGDIPIIKIDDPMMERAVELGDRISVIATASSTLGPSTDLVERKADQVGGETSIRSTLVEDAFAARKNGNVDRHDELVVDRAATFADESDVIVLAQASMSHLASDIEAKTGLPVMTSPDQAMERIGSIVETVE